MPSTFTPNLNLETPATGEQVDTWGDTVGANWLIIDALYEDVGGTNYPLGFSPFSQPELFGFKNYAPGRDFYVMLTFNADPAFAGSSFAFSFVDNSGPLEYPALAAIRTLNGAFNMSLLEGLGDFQDGEGVVFVKNCIQIPLGNPTDGGFLYVQSGALKYRGSSGTITTLAPA